MHAYKGVNIMLLYASAYFMYASTIIPYEHIQITEELDGAVYIGLNKSRSLQATIKQFQHTR